MNGKTRAEQEHSYGCVLQEMKRNALEILKVWPDSYFWLGYLEYVNDEMERVARETLEEEGAGDGIR